MIVLFDNTFLDATLTGGSASANYPLANLQDAFLRKRYQTTSAALTTVTATFDADRTIDVVFFGYTNASALTVRLKDSGDATLASMSFDLTNDTEALTFDSYDTVRSIEIDVSGGIGTYLGGFGAGEGYELSNPVSPWEEPYLDNSTRSVSAFGQTLQEYAEPLRQYQWTFRDVTRTEANAIRTEYVGKAVGGRVWLAPFEDDQTFIPAMYGALLEAPATVKNGRRYDLTMSFQEAR